MNSDPMTEEQGRKIISLLDDILYELKKVVKDSSSIESTVKFELEKIKEHLIDLKH
jgi:hypothetical protein